MDSAAQGKLRVAINGFGRIGRNAFKVALEDHIDEIEIVAINDLTEPKILAHLLEYDSAYGKWGKDVTSDEKSIIVDGKHYQILAEKDPTKLPWKDLNIDVVIESTGRFTDAEGMQQHLTAGAKKVVLSAPAKGDGVGTFLIGVNHEKYTGETLVNNGSCTTNCIAPVAAIIHEKFGIAKALMTTVHSVTAEQNLVDAPPPGGKSGDLRRARAAYANIIPTTSGAAIAVTQAIPQLKGLFDGQAVRVPTIVGSISDFTFLLSKKTTLEEVKQAIKDACETPRWKGIVAWSEDPLVSSDIIGRSESSIVDLPLTQLVDGDLLKIFAWYDNEWGYSNRLIEMVVKVGKAPASAVPPTPVAPPTEPTPTNSAPPLPPTPSYQAQVPMATRDTVHHSDQPLLTLPPLPSTSPSHEPKTFFAQPDLKAASTDNPAASTDGISSNAALPSVASPTPEPTLPPPDLDGGSTPPPPPSPTPNTMSAPAPANDSLANTTLPLTPAQPQVVPSVPPPAPPVLEDKAASPVDQANLAAALNMPGSPTSAPAQAGDVKIEDHVVSPASDGAAEQPKNNPFLNWFK